MKPGPCAGLGGSRRPAVRVTIGGHAYRSTVARTGGRYLVPLSAENRAAGVAAGDEVDVDLELDTAAREVAVPSNLAEELAGDPQASAFFQSCPRPTARRWVRWIEDAKKPETRAARLVKTLDALRAGERSR